MLLNKYSQLLPSRTLIVIIIYFINFVKFQSDASRILCIHPTDALSHFKPMDSLLIALANKGHDVTVISAFPKTSPIPRLTDIDCSVKPEISAFNLEDSTTDMFTDMYNIYNSIDIIENIFHVDSVQKLLSSGDVKFDLVITELFKSDALLAFAHKFNKTPSISISSGPMMPWGNRYFQNPDNPAYIPVSFNGYNPRMNFWQRLDNTFTLIASELVYKLFYVPRSDRLAKTYFGKDLPPLEEIVKERNLILVNTHHSLHGARPNVPGVIEVGGIHIQPAKPLNKDLEKFLNESTHGVVYFCMGSMLRAATLPNEKRQALIDVFAKLPQRVLWKWEDENMPGKPDNVKLAKWTPQRDVLAHPNVKLFISHGGLLGTTEAVHSGVPILGMPFYGDQGLNIEAVVANGAGLRLDFKDLNKESLEKAVTELLGNPKYKENAKDLSERFRDRPQTPLETAVYWTEYVIRHKGAPHLRSAAVDLAWYQYLLLDVIAFMILVSVLTLTIIYYTLKFIYNLIRSLFSKPQKSKTKKRKNE